MLKAHTRQLDTTDTTTLKRARNKNAKKKLSKDKEL